MNPLETLNLTLQVTLKILELAQGEQAGETQEVKRERQRVLAHGYRFLADGLDAAAELARRIKLTLPPMVPPAPPRTDVEAR